MCIEEKYSVVLVEPLYEINIGFIARCMKNFGFKKLYKVTSHFFNETALIVERFVFSLFETVY